MYVAGEGMGRSGHSTGVQHLDQADSMEVKEEDSSRGQKVCRRRKSRGLKASQGSNLEARRGAGRCMGQGPGIK